MQKVNKSLVTAIIAFLLTATYGQLVVLGTPAPGSWVAPFRTLTLVPRSVSVPVVTKSNLIPAVTPTPLPMRDGLPSWSAPIVASPQDEAVWVVNPDSGSVTKINPESLVKVAEIPIGPEPWSVAISPGGHRVYVVDRAAGALVVVDAQSHRVVAKIPVGPESEAIALNPTGSRAYITVSSAAEVAVVDTERLQVVVRIPVEPKPYAIAITDNGNCEDDDERVYVTHLLAFPQPGGTEATDDGRAGRVTVIEAGSNTITRQITLLPNTHGFPNLLAGIALTRKQAWIPLVRAAPALPNSLTRMVFAAVSVIDLNLGVEDVMAQLPLNDQDIFGSPVNNPVAAIPAPDGQTLYIVLAGSDLVEVVDVSNPDRPRLVKFLPTGKNPRGMALSPDGRRGYVLNYLSRSVTVLDLAQLTPITEVTVTAESLEPEVLQGKILFNNATNPKLSRGSWISCASCHPDGGADSVTWIFPDGPRQSPALWFAGQTRPWHWSAALDEAQDVEETVQLIQHGLGLAPGADPPQLGSPNAGRSAELDALAAFLERGIRPPAPSTPAGNAAQGRHLFQSAGCIECHSGPQWTLSTMPGSAGTVDPDGNGMVDAVLRDVGTHNLLDVRGESGFDPPSLLNIGLTAPYLHDGSLPTLETLLASGHPDPQGSGNGLDREEITVLATFLNSIGATTPPFAGP